MFELFLSNALIALTLQWLVVLVVLLSPALFSLGVLAWTKRKYGF